MNCRDAEARLSEYADGLLDDGDAARLRAHLDACPNCAETYASMIRLIGHMREIGTVEEPADLLANVKERLRKSERATPQQQRRWLRHPRVKTPLRLATAAILVCLVILLPWRHGTRMEQRISLTIDRGMLEAMMADGEMEAKAPREKRGKKGPAVEPSGTFRDVVRTVGGEVVAIEYDSDTGEVSALLVDVPAENRRVFLEKLEEWGRVTLDTPEKIPAGDDGTVIYRIRINPR